MPSNIIKLNIDVYFEKKDFRVWLIQKNSVVYIYIYIKIPL